VTHSPRAAPRAFNAMAMKGEASTKEGILRTLTTRYLQPIALAAPPKLAQAVTVPTPPAEANS
jgi:hypothetical protein